MNPECLACKNCIEITERNGSLFVSKLDKYCFYCFSAKFASGRRKIGSKASWTGRTPVWCPFKTNIENKEGEENGKKV